MTILNIYGPSMCGKTAFVNQLLKDFGHLGKFDVIDEYKFTTEEQLKKDVSKCDKDFVLIVTQPKIESSLVQSATVQEATVLILTTLIHRLNEISKK